MQTTNYTAFLVPETTQYYHMHRPYHLVILPDPSSVVPSPSPYIRTVLHPSYGASAAPLPSPPYLTHPQYLAYVPSTHYSLPAQRHQPVMVPIGLRHSSIQGWQRSTNIPPWQNRVNIPSSHRRANIPPRQRRANIPPRQRRASMSVMQGYHYDDPTPFSYVHGAQPQPSYEAEVMSVTRPTQVLETDDVTQGGGIPTAQHVLESLPEVVLSLDADVAECTICLNNMCTQDEIEITELPCNHRFHRACIMLWLSNNNTCPLCRFKLPTNEIAHPA